MVSPTPELGAPPEDPAWLRALPWLALLVGGWAVLSGIPAGGTPGADECLHAVGALRLFELLRLGDLSGFWREFHKPEFYTPLGRLGMGTGYLFDLGFSAPRTATGLAWIATIALCAPLARRVAPAGMGTVAVLWTYLFLFTSWLAVSYSRGTYLEAWSSLVTVIGVLIYLRARDKGRLPWAVACGVWLGIALLVKTTYGLFLVGAVGLSGLSDMALRPKDVRPFTIAAGVFFGALIILLWWFVLPLPMGLDYGAMHRATFIEYLTKAASLSTLGPEFLLVAWPLMACLSLPIFALQLLGLLWGLRHWSCPAARLCVVLGCVGPLAFAVYDFRIDRFLIPTLFGGCVLGGSLVAALLARLPRGAVRLGVGLSLIPLLVFSRGLGSVAVVRLAFPGERTPEQLDAMAASTAVWTRPFEDRLLPAVGPAGTRQVLDYAVQHLDPKQPFLWIGGTGTELPPILVDWALYQRHREPAILFRPRDDRAWFWSEPTDDQGQPWNEQAFRAFASTYSQVAVLDPPDPKGRPREFEVRYAAWMTAHPGFTLEAEQSVVLDGRAHTVRFYRTRP